MPASSPTTAGRLLAATLLALAPSAVSAQDTVLDITLAGNAGVILSDGTTSLLVDLPYEPGAFGYMMYDVGALAPVGDVVAVITHNHRDHFAAELFASHPQWRIIGPPRVVAGAEEARLLAGDSVGVGEFSVIAIPTPHTDDHRSYRIRWKGRVLHFTGDTDDPSALLSGPEVDLLFATPWFTCARGNTGSGWPASRVVLYHVNPDGSDRPCGSAEQLKQGASLQLSPRGS